MASVIYKERVDAVEQLAKRLEWLKYEVPRENNIENNNTRLIVLAIPRGGVIIGDGHCIYSRL
jgi:predicted phosphoribosyltransferase